MVRTPAEARTLFPVLGELAYLNAGTFGPLSRTTAAALTDATDRDMRLGRSGTNYFHETVALRDAVRGQLAGLVGVTPDTVALTTSTTEGCNLVLSGLALEPGDEIVTTTHEHFGLLGALAVSPARVVVVDPDPDAIVDAVTPRTRLLAVSHVLWTTGAVLPVRELRERTGIPVLVDAAQSVGAIPVDASGLDFVAISGQKWLCGPDSTGALVVADPERLRVTAPSYFSQTSYDTDGAFEPRHGAARFEQGWWSPGALLGLSAALGDRPQWAFERAAEMADRLRARLDTVVELVTPAARATLVAFRPEGVEPAALVERLHAAGVVVREVPGRGLVRASVGWWTDDEDLDRLVAAL